MRRTGLAFVLLLVMLGVPLGVAPWFGWGSALGLPQRFVVARGASLAEVAQALQRERLIHSAGQFRILARLLGSERPVQAGPYRLARGMPWRDILQTLQQGRTEHLSVTIPEGWPMVMVVERINKLPNLGGRAVAAPEGTILPDTYEYEPGEARAAVLRRMRTAMTRALAAEWPKRSPRTAVKTPEQAVILASIVEKETGKDSERATIAGVYSNRLRIGMKLDADPTVIYPITKGKPLGRRIRRSELQRDTGYNTYLKPGLPIGPIANPGLASLRAVLNPAETNALYFVADGSGGHVFAATLAEQNRNVERWFALRRQRGEM